ncbi:MAG: LysR family transcriptional regulator [Acidobacteriota bacterium]|nr:LysR family transcriptional regulator [Acidobacteriota bacterium]
MNVETLNIFCDVVRHRSFSRGAKANSVSQSAASQAVRQLERHLGAQLIDRSKRPWQVTTEGRIFFKGCQELVDRYHELEDAVRQQQNPSGHTVRLAAIYSVGLHHLSQYVDQFRARVPGAGVDLKYMHPDEIPEQVLNDQSDLGLMSFVTPRRELAAIPWRRQPMVVVCPPSHRIAQLTTVQGGVKPTDLTRERFVAFDRKLPARREIDRFLRRHEVHVNITAEFDNIETIKQAVDEGAGIAIVPEPTLRREVRRGTLVQSPFILPPGASPLVRPLSIVHRRNRRLHPAVTEFIKLLQTDGAETAAYRQTPDGGTDTATRDGNPRPSSSQQAPSSADVSQGVNL